MKILDPQNSSQEIHKSFLFEWVSHWASFVAISVVQLIVNCCQQPVMKVLIKRLLNWGRWNPHMDQNIQIYLFTYLVNSSHLNTVLTEEWRINIYENTGLSTKLFSWEISFVSRAEVQILLMIYSARTQCRLLHPSLYSDIWYMKIIDYDSYLGPIFYLLVLLWLPLSLSVFRLTTFNFPAFPWIFWCHASDCVSAVSHNWAKDGIWVFLCDYLNYLQQLLR